MKNLSKIAFCLMFLATACSSQDQTEQTTQKPTQVQENTLSPATYHDQKASSKLFVIEREMPGVGNLSPQELQKASQQSNKVLSDLGPKIKWIHSYVTDNKIYCVYSSPNKELIREHAVKAGFPANIISEAGTIIDPTTGE